MVSVSVGVKLNVTVRDEGGRVKIVALIWLFFDDPMIRGQELEV